MKFEDLREVKNYAEFMLNKNYTFKDLRGEEHLINMALAGYTFEWMNAKNTFGTCNYRDKVITLSRPLCAINLMNGEQINDTILHEFAHAMSVLIYGRDGRGHGKKWKHTAKSIGCNAERCFTFDNINAPKSKYTVVCDTCKKEQPKHRKSNKRQSCGDCSKRFDFKYLLRTIQNY